jgi:hypothetical protein
MSMTIEKAFDRIQWQLFTNKGIPNKYDVQSMKFIADWINHQHKRTINENQLFSKTYTELLRIKLWAYGDLNFALKDMSRLCKMPLSFFVETFARDLNIMAYRMYCEENGIKWEIEKDINDEERKEVYEYLLNDNNFKKHLLGRFKIEKVEESLTKEITEMVLKYKNHL